MSLNRQSMITDVKNIYLVVLAKASASESLNFFLYKYSNYTR